jgi:hypothetical protein
MWRSSDHPVEVGDHHVVLDDAHVEVRDLDEREYNASGSGSAPRSATKVRGDGRSALAKLGRHRAAEGFEEIEEVVEHERGVVRECGPLVARRARIPDRDKVPRQPPRCSARGTPSPRRAGPAPAR